VTFTCISRAPLDKLQAYKRRMGWTFPWASSHGSDYDFDLETSHPQEATREFLAGGVPAAAARLAQDCGTEPAAYLSETLGMSAVTARQQFIRGPRGTGPSWTGQVSPRSRPIWRLYI
jgi:predicted dithiol-disulfide oxidoreductase (DUF899 family)